MLPDCNAAVSAAIDMAVGCTRNPAADFEDLGFLARIVFGEIYLDIKFGDRTVGGSHDSLFENEIGALDTDRSISNCRVKLWLVECYRSLNIFECQQINGRLQLCPRLRL